MKNSFRGGWWVAREVLCEEGAECSFLALALTALPALFLLGVRACLCIGGCQFVAHQFVAHQPHPRYFVLGPRGLEGSLVEQCHSLLASQTTTTTTTTAKDKDTEPGPTFCLEDCQVGTTKVFFRQGALAPKAVMILPWCSQPCLPCSCVPLAFFVFPLVWAHLPDAYNYLEASRTSVVKTATLSLQRVGRGFVARLRRRARVAAAVTLSRVGRGMVVRIHTRRLRARRSAIRVQAIVRGRQCRRR